MRAICCWMFGILFLSVWSPIAILSAAEEAPPAEKKDLPEIADEPKTVDPATLMPEKLTVQATVDLSDSSLTEVVAWLRDEQKLVVLVKENALAEAGVLASEPVSDRLNDEPIYLLLNRLCSALDLGWYYENDVLYITSAEEVAQRMTTVPYNVGDLFDADYDPDTLYETIQGTISPDTWLDNGGEGALTLIGDVLFVRQTDAVQREVQGLLAALRKNGRRTFILDPPQHQALREALEKNVNVDLNEVPLEAAVRQLAETAGIDMRLDLPGLREAGVREREPVTIQLADRSLKTVLQAMLMDLDLDWGLSNGVLWITTKEVAGNLRKTAVYDVRDLCRNQGESDALTEAIMSQAAAESWSDNGGEGTIEFAKPGTMVVRNREQVLQGVLDLLETYRTALRASKPRNREKDDPKEVTTVYYRMYATMADDMTGLLKMLVAPDTWKDATHPDAPGEVLRVTSAPEVMPLGATMPDGSQGDAQSLVISRAVLIITQTRENHKKIAEVIRRVESGDLPAGGMGGMGGMGGYMVEPAAEEMSSPSAGFGGGFFSE